MSHFAKGDLKGGLKILAEDLNNALSDPLFVCSFSGGLKNIDAAHPGRLGGPLHRSMFNDIKAILTKWGVRVNTEVGVEIPKGGYRGTRYADLGVQGPGLKAYYIQVGKGLKSGAPVAREARAISDFLRAGKMVFFIPYN